MSIERHSRVRQIELGRDIKDRKKIYLDTRFWIILRDAEQGARSGASERKLLHFLRRGVHEGKLICPVSASIFMELMKQPFTATRRRATARLIDELSLGVSAVNPEILAKTEIKRFLLAAKADHALYSMQELIWTKVAYVLGSHYPIIPSVSPQEQLIIQKKFHDFLWDQPLTAIVDMIGNDGVKRDDFRRLSEETNVQNQRYREELKSFEGAYDIELRGVIDLMAETAADVIAQETSEVAQGPPGLTSEKRVALINAGRNLLYQAMKRQENRSALRSMHIEVAIHASMRWDKQRKFKPNDYYDFSHATMALAYCDAFFTEKPLHFLVTRPHVAFKKINNCRVISEVEIAQDFIRSILS